MKSNIQIKTIEEFWNAFSNETKYIFYNPLKKEIILGAKESERNNDHDIKLVLIPFFGNSKVGKWRKFTEKSICFDYYYKFDLKDLLIEKDVWEKNVTSDNFFKFKIDDYNNWKQLYDVIICKIKNKEVEKVVASREVELTSCPRIRIEKIFLNLLEKNPESFIFAFHTDGKTFLGATPEVLVEKKGSHIMSYALAGTIAKNNTNDAVQKAKLLSDKKNNLEHRIVVETIANTMRSVTDKVSVGKTELMELKNLFHLKTEITAEDNTLSLIEWAKLLHPTPAMGGKPKEKAVGILKKYEEHERGMFAAPIGIVDENGDGIFVVGIRSALIDGNKIYVYAGCGIVEQSDCLEEYEEMNQKMLTIMECL